MFRRELVLMQRMRVSRCAHARDSFFIAENASRCMRACTSDDRFNKNVRRLRARARVCVCVCV